MGLALDHTGPFCCYIWVHIVPVTYYSCFSHYPCLDFEIRGTEYDLKVTHTLSLSLCLSACLSSGPLLQRTAYSYRMWTLQKCDKNLPRQLQQNTWDMWNSRDTRTVFQSATNNSALMNLVHKKCDGALESCIEEGVLGDPCVRTWDSVDVYYTCVKQIGPSPSFWIMSHIEKSTKGESIALCCRGGGA